VIGFKEQEGRKAVQEKRNQNLAVSFFALTIALKFCNHYLPECVVNDVGKSRRKRATTKIKGPKVGFADLGLVVYGGKADLADPSSPMLEDSYDKGFNHKSNEKSWKAVGAAPLTRKCMSSPLIRHEITTTHGLVDNSLDPMSERYAAIESNHNRFIKILDEAGYLGSVFTAEIRRKAREALSNKLDTTVIAHLTEPLSPSKLKWLADAKTTGQTFMRMAGNGTMNIDVCFFKAQYKQSLKDIQELEEAKENVGDRQKWLTEAEETREKMKRSMIEEKVGNRRLLKDMLVSLIAGKLGRKPKSDLSKTALEKMWFDDGLKDEPTEQFRVWTEEDETKLQELRQGPKHIKDTLLGRTRERNITRFVDSINNVPLTVQQIEEIVQKLEDAKVSAASEPTDQVTIKFDTADEIDELTTDAIDDRMTDEMDCD
jgi:hypothetical protein